MKVPLLLSEAAARVSRLKMAGLSIPILFTLLFVAAATPARADGVTVTPLFQAQGVPEQGQRVQFNYTITNANPYPVILDYAFFSIYPAGPDTSDTGTWPTFSLWYPVIAPEVLGVPGTSNWVVSIGVSNGPPCTPTDCDFGRNSVTFASEWSPLVGDAVVVPWPVNSYFVFIDNDLNLVPSANYGNGVNGLLNGIIPSSPIDLGGQQVQVAGRLNVYDTPEPGSLYLLGSGLLGLAGILRRKLRRG